MTEWNSRILDPGEEPDFRRLVDRLFAQQLKTWAALRAGVEAFREVEYRRLSVGGTLVLLQHNPRRIVSTGAPMDSASISRRPCFLCPDNMPEEEKGLEFGTRFVVFCNPYPVLKNHLVLVSKEHRPQGIDGNTMYPLDFAEALGPEFFVLYNGPSSGASAPDHLHLQAGAAELIPVLSDLEQCEKLAIPSPAGIETFAPRNYRVNTLIIRGGNKLDLAHWIQTIVNVLAELIGANPLEPMLNVLYTSRGREWEVVIFPRERHRPSSFYSSGDDRLIVSPAAIDMGGLMVVPERRDFDRMDAAIVESIYREVTLVDEKFARLIGVLAGIVR
jgi:hypothetical protein